MYKLAIGIQAMHVHITAGPPLVTFTYSNTASCFLQVMRRRMGRATTPKVATIQ